MIARATSVTTSGLETGGGGGSSWRARRGRRRRGRGNTAAGALGNNLVPLFDVLFFLLFFFMVAANFDQRRVVPVQLPSAVSAEDRSRQANQTAITITLRADGALALGGEPISREALDDHLAGRPMEDRLLAVILEGDASASLGGSVDILDVLRRHGYRNCTFAVDRKPATK